ncbi:MAG: RNA methyltransferase [Planctomycetota bacterium]|nr:RNA methyltransferase [Planctomycetota bacterium]MDA1177654.1 RNA methyltransferase [Planctomycetota bacterium]
MPLVYPHSLADPQLAPYRNLPSSGRERRDGLFIAEGHWLVDRLWTSRHEMVSVLVAENRLADLPEDLVESVPVYCLTMSQLAELVGFSFHRGVLGCGRRKPLATPAELFSPADVLCEIGIALDRIADPENVGGILRNAAALGVGGVILGPGCADPFSRRVLRVSMGNAFQLRLAESIDLVSDLRTLRESFGYESVATVLDPQAELLAEMPRPTRMILVFGSEGHGISPEVVTACDRRVTIPMQLGTDSLNVATATAVVLYEFTMRRVADRDGQGE